MRLGGGAVVRVVSHARRVATHVLAECANGGVAPMRGAATATATAAGVSRVVRRAAEPLTAAAAHERATVSGVRRASTSALSASAASASVLDASSTASASAAAVASSSALDAAAVAAAMKDEALLRSMTRTSHVEARMRSAAAASADADPFRLVRDDLSQLTKNIATQLGCGSKLLLAAASHYFLKSGKLFRPALVLLMARATSPSLGTSGAGEPMAGHANAAQHRLAEITEMIHTASLVHDDLIDEAPMRRGMPAVHVEYSPKKAVLAGDYLLARASVALARLRNTDVVELLSTVIANLVEGEFRQMEAFHYADLPSALQLYLHKSYLKTASLLGKSAQAAAILGGCSGDVAARAYEYGRHLGLAFQIVDDVLDVTSDDSKLGKLASTDMSNGLATAPVLFAAEQFPELVPMINRRFAGAGDAEHARQLVLRSDGVARARLLAQQQCDVALRAISSFHPSLARDALVTLCSSVLLRSS